MGIHDDVGVRDEFVSTSQRSRAMSSRGFSRGRETIIASLRYIHPVLDLRPHVARHVSRFEPLLSSSVANHLSSSTLATLRLLMYQATVGPGVTGGDLATFLDSKDR